MEGRIVEEAMVGGGEGRVAWGRVLEEEEEEVGLGLGLGLALRCG
jgi:hypothetical protein